MVLKTAVAKRQGSMMPCQAVVGIEGRIAEPWALAAVVVASETVDHTPFEGSK